MTPAMVFAAGRPIREPPHSPARRDARLKREGGVESGIDRPWEELRAMASQILAKKVAAILRDATIQNVRFVLSGISVFGFRYEQVANAIEKGRITCDVGVTPNRNLSAGFVAKCRYEPQNRRLLFPNEQYGLSPGTQTFDIVH